MTDILPCPFCNGKAQIQSRYRKGTANRLMYWIECTVCGVSQAHHDLAGYRTKSKAITAWNRRVEMVVQMNGKLKFKAEQLIDEAYKKGYDDAKAELRQNAIDSAHEESDGAYKRGIGEAWAASRLIVSENGFKNCVLEEIFGYRSPSDIVDNYSGLDAVQKIHEYELKKSTEQFERDLDSGFYGEKYAIKAGDEILYTDAEEYDTKAVVMDVDQDGVLWILEENGCAITIKSSEVKRTGRHFEGVDSLLQQMRD